MRNRILLYLHCALTRRRYPFAAYIDTSVADFVQSAVFAAVFEDETVMSALMEAPTDFLHMLGHVLDDPVGGFVGHGRCSRLSNDLLVAVVAD